MDSSLQYQTQSNVIFMVVQNVCSVKFPRQLLSPKFPRIKLVYVTWRHSNITPFQQEDRTWNRGFIVPLFLLYHYIYLPIFSCCLCFFLSTSNKPSKSPDISRYLTLVRPDRLLTDALTQTHNLLPRKRSLWQIISLHQIRTQDSGLHATLNLHSYTVTGCSAYSLPITVIVQYRLNKTLLYRYVVIFVLKAGVLHID